MDSSSSTATARRGGGPGRRCASAALAGLLLCSPAPAGAKAFYARSEALALAFPGADRVESKSLFLTAEEARRVEELSKTPLESKLVTVHVGERGAEKLGYAFIDTQVVRTLPETLLVVIAPDATVQKLLLLAFYEPPEYQPSERWVEQFLGRRLDRELRVDRDVHGIAGATLTSNAATAAVRRSLALFQVLVQERK